MAYEFEALPRRRRGGFLRLILFLLLAAIIGFGVWIGLSAKRVSDLFTQAMSSYETMQASFDAQEYDDALAAARNAADLTSQASSELKGVQWDIAARIPVLGTDVEAVRGIGSISGSLADDAVLPVIDSWDQLAGDGIVVDGALDVGKIPDKVNQVVELAKTLQEASKVVDSCAEQSETLPTSHFGQVNEWADQLRNAVNSVDKSMDDLDVAVDLVVDASSLVSSLLDPEPTETAEPTTSA